MNKGIFVNPDVMVIHVMSNPEEVILLLKEWLCIKYSLFREFNRKSYFGRPI